MSVFTVGMMLLLALPTKDASVRVKAYQANVRAKPSRTASILATLPRGTVFELIETRGSWLKVTLRDQSLSGYVHTSLVETLPGDAGMPLPPEAQNQVTKEPQAPQPDAEPVPMPPVSPKRVSPPPPQDQLELGKRQVTDGDFETALLTLDAVVRRLERDSRRTEELVQAYLFLGVAYVGLLQETAARDNFDKALKIDRTLTLDPKRFPPRAIRVFEATKKGSKKSVLYAGVAMTPVVIAGASVISLAGAGVVGGVVINNPSPTPAPSPTPPPLLITEFAGNIGIEAPFLRLHSFEQGTGHTSVVVEGSPRVTFNLQLCVGAASAVESCRAAAETRGTAIEADLPAGQNSLILFVSPASLTPTVPVAYRGRITRPAPTP
ncbi:MAG TPA: SH3 domain-containing protein [Vicinamibacteria bacterium]|nr:SH3 domain-containing protein [Vicinamibacteria bacterium]